MEGGPRIGPDQPGDSDAEEVERLRRGVRELDELVSNWASAAEDARPGEYEALLKCIAEGKEYHRRRGLELHYRAEDARLSDS